MSDTAANTTCIFNLTSAAKNKGGDRYECEEDPSFVIYVPQRITRDGVLSPVKKLTVLIKKE